MRDQEEQTSDEPSVDLSGLPAEVVPGDLLEERIVRVLRARGLLRPPAGGRVPSRSKPRRLGQTPAWAVAAAAAALFLGGMAVGQYQGRNATVELLAAIRETDVADRAAMVQQTGSLYVTALAALARDDDASATGPGAEAALSALLAATRELARLDPEDGRIARVLGILNEQVNGTASDLPARQVIWF